MHRPSPPDLRVARARIGAVHLGIPVEAVVQAIPLPPTPAILPRRQGALYGVVEHRGMLVPVVDLARWVDVGTGAATRDARILVLRDGGRIVGLRVDTVGGLVDLPPHLVTRLHHDDNPEDVFHTAARAPDDGSLLSLLEVGRLADLALAWGQVEPQAAATPPAPAGPSSGLPTGTARTWALLRAGQGRLAVTIGDLAEVIPMPALSRFGGGIDSAYCTWRGRHLLVLPAGVFHPQAPDAGTGRLLAVIEHDGLALGFPVHEALQMAAFEDAGLPAPDGLGTILLDGDGTEVRLLDTARLFERLPEAALGKPEAEAGSARKPAAQRAANAVGYIVFDADGMQATPVGAVEQILPLASRGATMAWRDTTIALVDLRDRAAPGDGAAGHVLVVRGGAGHTGFVVGRVHSLIPPGTGTLYRMGGAAGQGMEFITTGDGAEQASYRTADLAARTDA